MKVKLSVAVITMAVSGMALGQSSSFVERDGATLTLDGQEFRFAGIHAPELHRIEDDARGPCAQDPRGWGQYFKWPTADEQENWIKSIVRTGQKATRIYTLSVQQSYDSVCGRETHILAPLSPGGMPRLNETAMVHYDRMLALANEHGLKIIAPFIDHWEWWGGRQQLAAFYGESADDFYDTSSQTYAAYKSIIEQVLARVNTISGVAYRDEPAILAWETGNELRGTTESFLTETVAHIESLDHNHLIQDGTYTRVNDYALNNTDVDIISNHYYTNVGNNNPAQVALDLSAIDGQKVYVVGEFGLRPAAELNDIMQAVVHTDHEGAKAAGGLVWGLRGHRHDGGFYWHQEYTGHYSYHYPGFPDGDANEEQSVVDLVRNAQAQMNGHASAQPLPVPEAPKLRPIVSTARINWLGAPVGRFYRIERANSAQGPWQTVASNISDGKNRYDPAVDSLFSDDSASAGETYYYRVFASNESGESGPSNIVVASAPEWTVFEAEAAALSGGTFVDTQDSGFNGSGYVTGLTNDGGAIEWHINALAAGQYSARLRYAADSNKQHSVLVNGQGRAIEFPGTGDYQSWAEVNVMLDLVAGTNTIRLESGWGYTHIDTLSVANIEGNTHPPVNNAPTLTFAAVQTDGLNAELEAQVTDDNLPQPGNLTLQWEQVSGPGVLTFSNEHSAQTQASASVAGVYDAKLTANDGELSVSDSVSFMLSQQPINQAPQVDIVSGADLFVGEPIDLTALVSDDGLPGNGLNLQWRIVSGAGASLSGANQSEATLVVSEPGTVVVELSVDDSELTTTSTVTLQIAELACDDCSQNLAAGALVTASSSDGYSGGAGAAVDGNLQTRWSSEWSDDQWLMLDLLQRSAIEKVVIHWEAAHGQDYEIQSSEDGANWTRAALVTDSDGGSDEVLLSQSARYLRVLGLSRATQWGYSIWELEVWGAPALDDAPELMLETSELDAPAQPWSASVMLYSDSDWVASSLPDWLSITPQSGTGDTVLTLSGPANAGASRADEVTFVAGSLVRSLMLTQAGQLLPAEDGIEAESVALTGVTVLSDTDASGETYVQMAGQGSLRWSITEPEAVSKVLTIRYRLPYSSKQQTILVNGEPQNVSFAGVIGQWQSLEVPVSLNAGSNQLEISADWGWMDFDRIDW